MNGISLQCEGPAADLLQQLAFIECQAWLAEPPAVADQRLRDHLAHCISRNPADLRAHVLRIHLCARAHMGDELYGALLDLFIALGDKGQSLRARLLARCRNLLTAPRLIALGRGMAHGIAAMDVVPEAQHSRLCSGISGSRMVVAPAESGDMPIERDVAEEARDLLDSGQILEARTLLEQALLDEPQNMAVSLELLAIYRHTRDLAGVNSILEKTAAAPLAAWAEWLALASTLEAAPEVDARLG